MRSRITAGSWAKLFEHAVNKTAFHYCLRHPAFGLKDAGFLSVEIAS